MSFWDNVKKFAQPYADDDYDDYDEDDEYLDDYDEPAETTRRAPRRTPAPAPAETDTDDYGFTPLTTAATASVSAPSSPAAPAASTGFAGSVLGSTARSSAMSKQEVVLFRPSTFNDTSKAAEDLRNNKAVIVNMENVDKAMARRVVDFLSGCVFALEGTVRKIAQSAYLFCPRNMDVVGDLETIQAEVESYI